MRRNMRPELKKKLDRESNRASGRVLLIAFLFLSIVLMTYGLTYFPLSVKSIQGESISLTAKQTDVGSLPRMRVRLDNERIVRAKMTHSQPFISGSKVNIEERKTVIGIKRYRFLSYVGINENE